jgi:hypothetical protein
MPDDQRVTEDFHSSGFCVSAERRLAQRAELGIIPGGALDMRPADLFPPQPGQNLHHHADVNASTAELRKHEEIEQVHIVGLKWEKVRLDSSALDGPTEASQPPVHLRQPEFTACLEPIGKLACSYRGVPNVQDAFIILFREARGADTFDRNVHSPAEALDGQGAIKKDHPAEVGNAPNCVTTASKGEAQSMAAVKRNQPPQRIHSQDGGVRHGQQICQ